MMLGVSGDAMLRYVEAGGMMLALALGFAIVLLIASVRLKVEVDPKVEQVYAVLPHLDCGACGFAGCSGYAKGVIADPELIGKCSPGGPKTSEAIGRILCLQISDAGAPKRPIVHCHARRDDKTFYAEYAGLPSCTSANALANVQACKFGCLGYGDCVRACKFDALHVIDGLSTVDYDKCTGCGACARACPRSLIEMVPFSQENMLTVACSNKETGRVVRGMCKVGCIGCGLCARQSDLFAVADNLARMDYAGYQPSEATETAVAKCPTKVIVYRGKTAPAEHLEQEQVEAAKSA